MVRAEHLVERAGVEHFLGPRLEFLPRRLIYTFGGFRRQQPEPTGGSTGSDADTSRSKNAPQPWRVPDNDSPDARRPQIQSRHRADGR